MIHFVPFALTLLGTAVLGTVALVSNRVSARFFVPAPALFLIGAAVLVTVDPSLYATAQRQVTRVVTVALMFILFEGGMSIGWRRFRSAAVPIAVLGMAGTFLTVGGAALLIHLAFGLTWLVALLVATAVAPTDPAVVFSVLGQQEIEGRSGTILEGESGANDPVGIALMVGLIGTGGVSGGALLDVTGEFFQQMAIGAVVGVVGACGLLWFTRRVSLPNEALYPLRSAAGVLVLYGLATVAHGSGFLAVFVGGIVLGDASSPYRREIRRFHGALASLGEIVAFAMLGLTVSVRQLSQSDVLIPGLILGATLMSVIRPVVVGACLVPVRLHRSERLFVLFAGLKGAVPILLGSFLLYAHVPDFQRLYGIIVIVVVFSVTVQGSLVVPLARWLHLPLRPFALEPWALGVRLQDKPTGVYNLVVAEGSPADGCTMRSLSDLPPDTWVSLVVRDGSLIHIGPDARLQAGDDVLVQSSPDAGHELEVFFTHEAD